MAGTRNPAKLKNLNDVMNDVLKELPARLVSCLMPFQKEGVVFCVKKEGRCLIADEMGLGKTLQAIAVAYYYRSEWPLLIMVPSSLRYSWIEELEKWLPDILPHEINLIQGGFDTGGIADAKVTIVTYGLLSYKSSSNVKEALQACQFKVVVCDESHYFKNSRTECCKAVTPLLTSAKRCLLLSGTPAVARPSELFTQLDALMPGKFGSFWSFTKRYCGAHWEYFGRRRQWRADGASNLDELQQRLTSLMIRREKSVVLPQLPAKQRQKILFPLKDSSTKKEILSTFAELKPLLKRSRSPLAANLMGGEANSAGPDGYHAADPPDTDILSRIQRLYNLTGEAKIGPAREYIQMLCANADLKFLVFAYHHSMMDGLQQALWDNKVKCVRIDGHTKPSERQLYVQQFQSDKNIRVALLSILAAGVGLTLTAASLVVFVELYWTPGVMVQCEDRVHRIGQTASVPIHYLVAKDTMDEWVWSAVCKKTLVMTTALSGKRQALQADAGNTHQVELLSSADAYTPMKNADTSNIDVMELVQSQLPQDQKSILDFFSSQTPSTQVPASSPLLSRKQPNGCKIKEHALDLIEVKPDLTTDKSPSGHNSGKKTYPLFTALKKTPCCASKSSRDLIVVDSSEDEIVSAGLEKPTSAKSPVMDSNSKKRKCSVVTSHDMSSDDSQFEEIPPSYSATQPKRKKSDAKTVPKSSTHSTSKSLQKRIRHQASTTPGKSVTMRSVPKDSVCKTPGDSKDRETDIEWPCCACTFSNTWLLPFCEMCNTPRKQKRREALSHSQGALPLKKVTDASTFLSPTCTGIQVSVCRMATEADENLTESEEGSVEDNKPKFSRQARHDPGKMSEHKVNRNLELSDPDELHPNFEIVLSDVDDELETKEDELSFEGLSSQERQRTSQSHSKSGGQSQSDSQSQAQSHSQSKSQQYTETSATLKVTGFQRLSSFKEQDMHQSAHFLGYDDEAGDQDYRISVCHADSCRVQDTLCTSQKLAHKSNPEDQLIDEVSECYVSSAGLGSTLPSCMDQTYNTLCRDSSEEPSDAEFVSALDVKASPVVRQVKRRCFMLRDDEEQGCVGTLYEQSTDEKVGERSPASSLDPLNSSDQVKSDSAGDRHLSEDRLGHVRDKCDLTGDKLSPSQDKSSRTGDAFSQSEDRSTAADQLSVAEDRLDHARDKHNPGGDKVSHSQYRSIYIGDAFSHSECRSTAADQLNVEEVRLSQVGDKFNHIVDNSNCSELTGSITGLGNKQNELLHPNKAEVVGVTVEDCQDLHRFFQFCCSSYTGRVYLFDEQGGPLNANFLPLDVELGNLDQLPNILQYPQHLRLAKTFVRHWNSLTDTKQRLISKRGLMFRNPLAAYDQVRTDLTNNRQRYQTKEDQAKAALKKATELNGHVRVLSKSGRCMQQTSDTIQPCGATIGANSESTQKSLQGYVQAMSEDGTPLCLHCQQPCSNLVSMATSTSQDGAWNTRFCSRVCADAQWMKTNTAYLRSSLYDLQFGVCQLCGFDAHTLFIQIRDFSDIQQRAEKLSKNKFGKLSANQRKQMVARPYEGLFWQVDHIHPVWEGGGQCDIDNLRTVCTPCHQEVTAKQAAKRAAARRLITAAPVGNITAFFKKV